MAKGRMLYTDLQFGGKASDAISIRINYKKAQAPKNVYIKLQRKDSNDLNISICVPGHISPGVKVFPDGHIDYSGVEYVIVIEGLNEVRSSGNDVGQKIYELRTKCSTTFEASTSTKGSKLQLTLTDEKDEDSEIRPPTVSKKKKLALSVDYMENSTYIVTSKSLFPSPRMFFMELLYDGRKFVYTKSSNGLRIPVWLVPKCDDPRVQVYVGNPNSKTADHLDVWQIQKRSEPTRFKTHLTPSELQALHLRCMMFALAGEIFKVPIPYLWRTKPRQYWTNIIHSNNSMMEPYRKDFNGDPRSIINGNIDGLFFSASVNTSTMQPSTFSWFGNKRMYIRVDVLIHPGFNIYFADFYCHYRVHYVTLVITKPGSKADNFCKAHLPRLKSAENLFLSQPKNFGPWYALASKNLHVEVLYTESLNITEICRRKFGYFEDVRPQGRGHSRPEGIPKNASCTRCNI